MSKCKLTRNIKAQAIFVSIMISIIGLILVVILANPLKDEITQARINTSKVLNCTNSTLAIEHQATCTILDMSIFYFIGILIAASIAYISGKKSFTGVITAIMVFVVVSVLITPLKTLIVLARDSTHLDCTNAAITVGGKLACIIVDIWLFYFVVTAISIAVAYIFVTKVIKK